MALIESTSSTNTLLYNMSQGTVIPNLFIPRNYSTVEGSLYKDKEILSAVTNSKFRESTNDFAHVFLFESPAVQFWIRLIISGILTTVVAMFGILGNTLSIFVLSKKKMQSSISVLMIGLSVSDLVVCLNITFMNGILEIVKHSNILTEYLRIICHSRRFIFPFANVALTASAYFTVAIAIERYVAVCWPIKCRSFITRTKTLAASAFIVLFAFAICTPNFIIYFAKEESFDYTNRTCKGTESETNYPRLISFLVFMYAVPISVVTVVNATILRKVRRMNVRRDSMTPYQRRKVRLTTMLFTIVAVYLVCNTPRLINEITKLIIKKMFAEIVAVTNFLVTLNSSVNYLIYCAFGKTFRQSFVNLFLKCGHLTCDCSECCSAKNQRSNEADEAEELSSSTCHTFCNCLFQPVKSCCAIRSRFAAIKKLIPVRSQQYSVNA